MMIENNSTITSDVEKVKTLNLKYKSLKDEIAKVIVGQNEIIELILISILAKGHCLLVGVPGLAKTLIVKTLSDVLNLKFNRIQFTPDLMPSDITGTEILESDSDGKKFFKFIKGPIFANLLLADEINRTPPKTQSALLEAMQERKVTAAGVTHTLEEPFFVLATQNPIEQEGTYPLPEAQLDRFMFNLWLDYPSFNEEIEIIKRTTSMYSPELKHVIEKDDILQFQELVKKVPVSDEVINFAVTLSSNTRPGKSNVNKIVNDFVSWGAGPRAAQNLILGAKTLAILDGRYTPEQDDVRRVALPVLRHRIILNFNADSENVTVQDIVNQML